MEQSLTHKNELENKPMKREIKTTPVGVRVALPEAIAEKVQKTLVQLKDRGADLKADDLLAVLFNGLDDRYLSGQLELLTPPSFYLERAKEHPELLARLIQQAKQGVMRIGRGETPVKPRQKRRTSEKSEESNGTN